MKKYISLTTVMSVIVIAALLFLNASGDASSNVAAADEIETIYLTGDYLNHDSIDHLASRATDIVRAVVLDSRVEQIEYSVPPQNDDEDTGHYEPSYEIHTIYRLSIL